MAYKKLTHEEWRLISFFFSLLGVKHTLVREHCRRVGVYAARTAKRLGKDVKAAYLAGTFHDLGKVFIDGQLFSDKEITNEEYGRIKEHALLAYKALNSVFPFTSLCCGFHHNMGVGGGYGLEIDDIPKRFCPYTAKLILEISEIVAICDFVDAYLTRKTSLKDRAEKDTDLKQMLTNRFPEATKVIETVLQITGG